MSSKLPLCCSRIQSRLTMDKTNLGRLAQKAAVADQKNRDISKLRVAMDEARAVIRGDEQALIEHEAAHADGMKYVTSTDRVMA
jgi:hypothetical protein